MSAHLSLGFILSAAFTLVTAAAAMSLRNLVHCALCAALALGGLAAVFLELGAQFVGLAQVLVYVGAVAILIVFAILLTRASEPVAQKLFSNSAWTGIGVAGLVWLSLTAAVLFSPLPRQVNPANPAGQASVQNIGTQLMGAYVVPLEILALLLTAATIGAVIIALHERSAAR